MLTIAAIDAEIRLQDCARVSVTLTETQYNAAGYPDTVSWEIARHRAADEGLCEHPASPVHLSLDPAIRMRARYADLLKLTVELRGIHVSTVV